MIRYLKTNGKSIKAAGLFILFTSFMTWPAVLRWSDTLWGGLGDAFQFPWNAYWLETALSNPEESIFFTDIIYYPAGVPLYFHDLSLVNAFFGMGLSQIVNGLTAYNLTVLFHYVLTALAMYWLVRTESVSHGSAVFAGTALTFCPFRTAHLNGHLSLMATEWLPLYFLAILCLFFSNGNSRSKHVFWAVMAGVFASLSGLSSYYYLLFLVLVSLPFVAGLFMDAGRSPGIRDLVAASITVVVTATIMLPVLIPAVRHYTSYPRDYTADYEFVQAYAADPVAYFYPQPFHPMWIQKSAQPEKDQRPRDLPTETTVTSGYTILLLGLIGFFSIKRIWRWRWLMLTAFVFSLGPHLQRGERISEIDLPYNWISTLPFLSVNRVPCRISILVTLSLVVMGAMVLDRIQQIFTQKNAWIPWLATAVLLTELMFLPVKTDPIPVIPSIKKLAEHDDGKPVLITLVPNQYQMYYQTLHRHPISSGAVSRIPQASADEFEECMLLISRQFSLDPNDIIPRRAALSAAVTKFGFKYILAHNTLLPQKEPAIDAGNPAIMQVLPYDLLCADSRWMLFSIPDAMLQYPVCLLGEGWGDLQAKAEGKYRVAEDTAELIVRSNNTESLHMCFRTYIPWGMTLKILSEKAVLAEYAGNVDGAVSHREITVELAQAFPEKKILFESVSSENPSHSGVILIGRIAILSLSPEISQIH
ncbi:hypothetical protein JW979_08050 [bacterium]|nr:hypothetical protein [candidate division CSSED10-310 bacterium]